MLIKVGAGLSAVIVVLFFSACTYAMRRRTNLRIGCSACKRIYPTDRPTMSSVLHMLASDTITLPIPKQPAVSIG
ncbi:hypothetical protein NC653_027049 [Populus alba x Populus x berolinensis]|uniref:Uncharacterized protein n=1 Tax=Populus alba x Populus x berolinensis TaxID=444605 RepID=A0AAD6Q4L2_9ROSI|nr:hypothetical protein NC653_027049 [Populus alba x Populus x berolinensis]